MSGRTTQAEMEHRIWAAMDLLRGTTVPPHEHVHLIAALLFLKDMSDRFGNVEENHPASRRPAPVEPSFYVPRRARWDVLTSEARSDGGVLNVAMAAVEQENPTLEGVFWGVDFSRLDGKLLDQLVQVFSGLDLRDSHLPRPGLPGEVLETVFQRAAAVERHSGEVATPPEVADLMVGIVNPRPGMAVYDPACGIGDLLTRSARYTAASVDVSDGAGESRWLGRERAAALWARGRMNMLLHRLPNARLDMCNSLTDVDLAGSGADERFDRVLTHPPFAFSRWSGDLSEPELRERFTFGVPPRSNGDYAWIQHAYAALKEGGIAGVLMPRGVLFRRRPDEEIRRKMLEHGAIEGVVTLPAKLLYNAVTPTVILVLRRHREPRDKAPVFFLDATQQPGVADARALTAERIAQLVATYHARDEIPGFARLVPFEEIASQEFILNVGMYLHAEQTARPLRVQQSRERILRLERRRRSLARKMDRALDDIRTMNIEWGSDASST